MRKYYHTRTALARSSTTSLDREIEPWEVMSAFIRGTADAAESSYAAKGIEVCENQDVKGMLQLSRDLDNRLIEYNGETGLRTVRFERQLACLLKKFPFGDVEGLDPRQKAVDNLLLAEGICRHTNEKLRSMRSEELPSWVPRARQLIADVLGELTPSLVMKIISDGSHGPGATLSSNSNRTTPYYKYMDLPYTVTPRARTYALAAISCNPRWVDLLESKGVRKSIPPLGCPQYQKELTLFDSCVEVVESDRITFVPKDASKERPIAIGASLNMYLQLAVKSYMQSRLKRAGVDLSDQSKNQKLAKAGSRFAYLNGIENPNQYSTIDLSNASDTISIEIVKLLLDPLWFAFLTDLRHDTGDLDGDTISYEKFSAMGNGFTFPLESLIFWAVAKAASLDVKPTISGRDMAIYGDDIIVRKWAAESVIRALNWAGFSINQEKSFISGYFKESCGADWFRGHNVRPFYLKRRIRTREDIYFVCNSIADLCARDGLSPGLHAVYKYLLTTIDRKFLRLQPWSLPGDGGLRVPLSSVARILGSRPFLDREEHLQLCLSGFLDEDPDDYAPYKAYSWTESYRAISYKGYERGRLFVSLGSVPSEHLAFQKNVKDLAVLEANGQGLITRRKSVRKVMKVRCYPDWDGLSTKGELLQHPAFWGL